MSKRLFPYQLKLTGQKETKLLDFFYIQQFLEKVQVYLSMRLLLIEIIWSKCKPNKIYIFFVCKLLLFVISPVRVIKNWNFVISV